MRTVKRKYKKKRSNKSKKIRRTRVNRRKRTQVNLRKRTQVNRRKNKKKTLEGGVRAAEAQVAPTEVGEVENSLEDLFRPGTGVDPNILKLIAESSTAKDTASLRATNQMLRDDVGIKLVQKDRKDRKEDRIREIFNVWFMGMSEVGQSEGLKEAYNVPDYEIPHTLLRKLKGEGLENYPRLLEILKEETDKEKKEKKEKKKRGL